MRFGDRKSEAHPECSHPRGLLLVDSPGNYCLFFGASSRVSSAATANLFASLGAELDDETVF
jgi:hypothetical protein